MMLNQPGSGCRVDGELYALDARQLDALDALESIGVPGNFRVPVAVVAIGGTRVCSAFVYMKSAALAVPAHTGYLTDYRDQRFIAPTGRLRVG
jgi:gamma-glutamylaminecyclotransferase